jgi:fibronectin-binding autotransporter adhesin
MNPLRSPGILTLLLILAATPPVLAQNSYTWAGGTGTWSNAFGWNTTGSGNFPGDEGATTTDTATINSGVVTYDSGATGFVGTLAMQTTSTANDYLVLRDQGLTINKGGNLFTSFGNSTSTGVAQIDLENNNLTIASGATFTLGSTTGTTVNANAAVYITNGASASGATTGTGGVIINGTFMVANGTGTATGAGLAAAIAAPITIGATGTLNLNSSSTLVAGENRLYIFGNFSTTSGSQIIASGTGSTTSALFFEGSSVNIASGTVIKWADTASGALSFTNTTGQNVSFGTLFGTSVNLQFTNGANNSTATDVVSSSVTSGTTTNAINQVSLKNNGTSNSVLTWQLGSNLNLITSGPAFNGITGLGANVGNRTNIDLHGFQYTIGGVTANSFFSPGASTTAGDSQIDIINSGATALSGNTISGTSGIFKFGFFGLSLNDLGVGSGVIINAQTGTTTAGGISNNLGVEAGGVTTISPTSAFYYTGTGSASLTSNRTIGELIVGSGSTASYLQVSTAALNTGAGIAVNTGATLDLNGLNVTETTVSGAAAGGLTGAGTVLNSAASTTSTLTLDTANGNGSFTGLIKDNGGTGGTMAVALTGTGTQTFSGASTYSGGTIISGGDLIVSNSTGNATGSGNVTLGGQSGGSAATTLRGTGTVAGLITSSANSNVAHIAPGATVGTAGTLHVGSLGFTIGAGTNFDYDLSSTTGGSNDLISMGGTLAIGGTGIVFNFNALGTLATTGSYTLISGASGITGFSASDFTATGIGSDTATFATVGNNLVVSFSQAVTATTGTYSLATTAGAGVLHVGASTTLSTTLTNTGNGTADSLNVTGLGASSTGGTVNNGPVNSGSAIVQTGTLTNGGQTFTATTAGSQTVTGSVTSVTGANSTGTATQAGNTGANVFVYTGAGVWTTSGGGTWGTTPTATPANWQANGGIPGITAGFTTTDSASFGDTGFSGTATVTLDGASPFLNAISFNNGTGSYNIAKGTGGTIHLDSTGTATITDTLGNHTISAPMELDSNSATVVSSASTLTVSGNISESGSHSFNVGGLGTTVLSGSNSYSGGTTVNTGATLKVTNVAGSATGTGAFALSAGATLTGTGAINASSFALGGVGSPAIVVVGNGLDTTSQLALTGSGSNSITNTQLNFNLSVTTPGQANVLQVGSSSIAFSNTTLELNMSGVGVVATNTGYELIAGLSNSQYSGFSTFINSLNQIEIVSGGGLNFNFVGQPANSWYQANSYLIESNGDIDVVVVPEPGTWAMMLGGLGVLLFWQRRRARAARS